MGKEVDLGGVRGLFGSVSWRGYDKFYRFKAPGEMGYYTGDPEFLNIEEPVVQVRQDKDRISVRANEQGLLKLEEVFNKPDLSERLAKIKDTLAQQVRQKEEVRNTEVPNQMPDDQQMYFTFYAGNGFFFMQMRLWGEVITIDSRKNKVEDISPLQQEMIGLFL